MTPLLLVLIGIALLSWSVPGVIRGQSVRSYPGVKTERDVPKSAEMKDEIKNLEGELDRLTRDKNTLDDKLVSVSHEAEIDRWLLAMVLSIAGILTLAQGVFAYFSAQNYIKQADDAIGRVNESAKRVETLAADVRNRYPMFAEIESARKEAFAQLTSLIPLLDEDQNLYAQSDAFTRQGIFATESFSAIPFLGSGGKELLGNLRLLGKFYAGKYAAEVLSTADFERSFYYFQLALDRFGRPFTVLNDLGWLYAAVAKPPDLERARAAFEESLRRNPNQQRARFNLGTLDMDRGDETKLVRAKNQLLEALRQQKWEETSNPVMTSHIPYNLACICDGIYECRKNPNDTTSLNEAMDYFEKAAVAGVQPRNIVEEDLATADLRNLSKSANLAERLRAALANYEKVWQ